MARRHPETNRTTGIADDQDDVAQLEPVDEALQQACKERHRCWVAGIGGRKSEAWKVQCDAPELVAQPADELAIEERPVRGAVQEQQDWALAFIHVLDTGTVQLDAA